MTISTRILLVYYAAEKSDVAKCQTHAPQIFMRNQKYNNCGCCGSLLEIIFIQ